FIAYPLRISFPRPHIEGAVGFLFQPLSLLDQPFNQAPSLHVATMTILYDLYARVLPRWALLPFALWTLIVVVSVMSTYQHHFIDVPPGFLPGVLCGGIWAGE